jgi:hypothetical protein
VIGIAPEGRARCGRSGINDTTWILLMLKYHLGFMS